MVGSRAWRSTKSRAAGGAGGAGPSGDTPAATKRISAPAVSTRPPSLSPASVPADRLLVQVDMHLLDLHVLLGAPGAQLAADAAHLVAAPGGLDVGRLHVVHPHDPRLQALHHAEATEP